MATIEELVLKLEAESTGLRNELRAAQVALEKSTGAMTKAVDTFAKDGAKQTSFFQNAWATMAGFVGGQFVTRAIDSATGLFKDMFNVLVVDGIGAASATQSALNDVAQALARSGNYSKAASDSMVDFANALESTTEYGDDAILSTAALIQNIARLDSEGLQKATKTTLDLASAMNLDLNTASQLVGKAIEGNVGALARYGIRVEEGRTKSETFANVMKALNDQFGGSATSKLLTFDGAMKALGNAFGNIQETIGFAIIENKAFVNVLNVVKDIINQFNASLDPKTLREYFASALTGAINFTGGILSLSQAVSTFVKNTMDGLQGIGVLLGAVGSAAVSAATGNFSQAAETIKEALNGITEEFSDNEANVVLDTMANKLADIKAAADAGYAATVAGATAMIEPTNQARTSLEALAAQQEYLRELSITRANEAIQASYTIADANAIELEENQLLYDSKLIDLEEYNANKFELLTAQQQEEYELLLKGLEQTKASTEESNAALMALERKQALDRNKLLEEQKEREKKLNAEKVQAASDTFGNLAVLASSGNRELAAIGKASAITQATIAGVVAVQNALKDVPFPLNIPLAASIGVKTAANVAKIASTPLQTGIDSVPGIGTADNFPAILAPGERVVPARTNEDLTRFLANQQSSGPSITVNVQMNDVFTSDPRDMGLKIVNVINEVATANGIKILSSSVGS